VILQSLIGETGVLACSSERPARWKRTIGNSPLSGRKFDGVSPGEAPDGTGGAPVLPKI
jgi:hypothetical protein